jgi:hypothetical protein
MNDSLKIGNALDRLMLAKNKPLLSPEAKIVWIEELADNSMEAIAYAVKTLIKTPNQFPEVASLLELCGEWRKKENELKNSRAWYAQLDAKMNAELKNET